MSDISEQLYTTLSELIENVAELEAVVDNIRGPKILSTNFFKEAPDKFQALAADSKFLAFLEPTQIVAVQRELKILWEVANSIKEKESLPFLQKIEDNCRVLLDTAQRSRATSPTDQPLVQEMVAIIRRKLVLNGIGEVRRAYMETVMTEPQSR